MTDDAIENEDSNETAAMRLLWFHLAPVQRAYWRGKAVEVTDAAGRDAA